MTEDVGADQSWFLNDKGRSGVQGMLPSNGAAAFAAILAAQNKANLTGSLLEIGVYHGLTFIGFVRSTRPGERAVAVDMFRMGNNAFEDIFRSNLAVHVPAGLHSRIKVLSGDSRRVPQSTWLQLVDPPARLVHIDGLHTRSGVLHDLAAAHWVLDPRGVVIFDDLFHEWLPEVTEAIIDGLRASPDLVPIGIVPRGASAKDGGSKLVCARTAAADFYREVLMNAFPRSVMARQGFVGRDVLLWNL